MEESKSTLEASMNKYVAFLKELWNKKYLEYRLKLVKELKAAGYTVSADNL